MHAHVYSNMLRTFFPALMVLLLVVSAEGSVGPSTNNSFCTESRECLEYEFVCKTDEYEVRHYSPTRWVSTDAEAYFMGVGAAMAFRRLFQYITGANEEGVQMEMTAPVLVKIPEETKMWEPAIYTLNFPLPTAYQEKPPKPTNDKLYFTEMPDMDVYVRSYGGWMLSVTSRLHAHLLTKELSRVKAPYNHTYHYGVGYDSPLKLLNRHNEVWYVAEGEPVCTDPQEPTPAHTPTPTPAQADSPTGASSAALPDTHSGSPASTPSNLASNTVSDSSTLLPSNAPSMSTSYIAISSPSQVPHEASFSLPSNPVVPGTNSSISPSLEPQTSTGHQTVTGPQNTYGLQNFNDSQTFTGLQNVNSPQNVTDPQTVTGLQNVNSPQNVTDPQTVTGPQNVNSPQNVTDPQTVTGPQNVNSPQNVTDLQTVTGNDLQAGSDLQVDTTPWNHTMQGSPQAKSDPVAKNSDTH